MIVWKGRLWLEPIPVLGVKCQKGATVLESESQVARHHARAEALVIALDERDAIPVFVHDAEINRVTHFEFG